MLTHTYSSHSLWAVPRMGTVKSLLSRATVSQRVAFNREMLGLGLPETHEKVAAGPGTRGDDRV